MVIHNKIKTITFSLDDGGGTPNPINFECQISSWEVQNNTDDPTQHYTLCPDGSFYETAEPAYGLSLTFFSDWQTDGISDWLWQHDGDTVDFVLDHLPNVADQHVQWTGSCLVKAPNVGGDARATESQTIVLQVVGEPNYIPNADVGLGT